MQVKMLTTYILRLKIKKEDYYRLLAALEQHKDDDCICSYDKACVNYLYERYKSVMANDSECYIYINDGLELQLIYNIVHMEINRLFKNSNHFAKEIDDLFNKYYWLMDGD